MKQPESIILAFANITSEYLDNLHFELNEIRDKALKNAMEKNFITLTEIHGARLASLLSFLDSGNGKHVTMLHYSGHSSKEGLIVQWHDKEGRIKSDLLSDLVKIHKKFRFVFLNSCCSKDIAAELISAGVPYVIGTTDVINDRQAAIVAGQFYHFLAKTNRTIQDAFSSTRIYFEDPSYNDNAGIKEAFRSFVIKTTSEDCYPWELYESPNLKEEDKNWVLIPETPPRGNSGLPRKTWRFFLIISIGIVIPMIFLLVKLYYTPVLTPSNGGENVDSFGVVQSTNPKTRVPKPEIHKPATKPLPITKHIIIEGSVKDNKTGELLDSVTVIINGVRSTTKSGWFTIKLPHTIRPNVSTYIIIKYSFKRYGYLTKSYEETVFINSDFGTHTIDIDLIKSN